MYFSKSTILVLAAALPTVFGSPILESRQNGVTCQTSSGSPKTEDVTSVINQLNGQGGLCPQTNGEGSDCTTLVKHGSAAITVCGGKEDKNGGSLCSDIAGFADQIQQTCVNGDSPDALVGGTYTISPSKRVEVIDTSSV